MLINKEEILPVFEGKSSQRQHGLVLFIVSLVQVELALSAPAAKDQCSATEIAKHWEMLETAWTAVKEGRYRDAAAAAMDGKRIFGGGG